MALHRPPRVCTRKSFFFLIHSSCLGQSIEKERSRRIILMLSLCKRLCTAHRAYPVTVQRASREAGFVRVQSHVSGCPVLSQSGRTTSHRRLYSDKRQWPRYPQAPKRCAKIVSPEVHRLYALVPIMNEKKRASPQCTADRAH